VIHAGQQVLYFLVAPVGENRPPIHLAAAVAAAVVHGKNGVTVRGKKLALEVQLVLILPVRATMNAQQQRQLLRFVVSGRRDQQAVHHCAVFALERHVFGGAELQLGEQFIVLVREWPERALLERVNFRNVVAVAPVLQSCRPGRHRADDTPSLGDWLDGTARDRHAREVAGTIVGDEEVDELAVL
jgi:hypothetical protein